MASLGCSQAFHHRDKAKAIWSVFCMARRAKLKSLFSKYMKSISYLNLSYCKDKTYTVFLEAVDYEESQGRNNIPSMQSYCGARVFNLGCRMAPVPGTHR